MQRNRTEVNQVEEAVNVLIEKLHEKINSHGMGLFVSPHECYGVIKEELDEFGELVRKYTSIRQPEWNTWAKLECLDIAIAALWSYISLNDIEKEKEQ